jgi:mono/diheme cytochrome c family protein
MQHRFLHLAPVLVAATWLAGCGGGGPAPPTTASNGPSAATASPGARLYLQNCIACHQRNGEGVPGVQPSLAGTVVTIGDPEALLAWVMYGVRPETLPKGQYRGVMPQFAYLSDGDLAVLTTYIRTSFGNSASAVGPDLVQKVRAAHAK